MAESASPSATRYADSVVSRGGAHLLHPVPDPPRAMGNSGNGSRKRLHMGYGGSPVHFDFLKLPFKDIGDP